MAEIKRAPIEVEYDLVRANVAGGIFRSMPRDTKDRPIAILLAEQLIDSVGEAWATLLANEPQAPQWGANARYLRTRALLETAPGGSDWTDDYRLVRYICWALLPQAPVGRGTNLLDGDPNELDTLLATYLAEHGEPKTPGDSVYGWRDSERFLHARACGITHIAEVHEDQWGQFNDTFSPNSVLHGLTGTGTCRCGYVSGELRVEVDLSELLTTLLRKA